MKNGKTIASNVGILLASETLAQILHKQKSCQVICLYARRKVGTLLATRAVRPPTFFPQKIYISFISQLIWFLEEPQVSNLYKIYIKYFVYLYTMWFYGLQRYIQNYYSLGYFWLLFLGDIQIIYYEYLRKLPLFSNL